MQSIRAFAKLTLLVLAALLLAPTSAWAAPRTASVSGNWNNTATWGGSAAPVAGDTVTINSGINVTVDTPAVCTSLTWATTIGANTTLTISGSNSLTVSGAISMPRPSAGFNLTMAIGAGTVSCGSLTMSATVPTASAREDIITISTGTLTISGAVTCGTTACLITFSGAGTMNLGHVGTVFSSALAFTAGSSTVSYNGSGNQTTRAFTYNNLVFSGSGAKSMATGTSVAGNLSIAPTGTATASVGTGLTLNVGTLTLGGVGRDNGTWGSSSSSASYRNNSYFAATTGILNVATSTAAVSAGLSSVAAAPATVASDGSATSIITVTLRNGSSVAVAGKTVTLASSRGATDTISLASGVSDEFGVVTFSVTSSSTGAPVFTATDTTDDVIVSQTATVTFTLPPGVVEISNALFPYEAGAPQNGIDIDAAIGSGNTGRLVGLTQTNWRFGFTLPVNLNGNTLILGTGWNNHNYYGAISGNGEVRTINGGQNHIGGSTGNTYTGTTYVDNGGVWLEKTSGNALCGAITVKGSLDSPVVWVHANQISDISDVTLANTGALNLAGFSDTINNLYLVTGSYVQTGAGGVLKVAKLYLNGVQQPEVAKMAGDGLVLGTGYIEVGASGPPVIVSPPATPATPTPADGSTTVHPAMLTKLDWTDCAGATSFDVYLWLPPAAKPATPTANVFISEYTVSPQVLSLSTYKWQVVARNTAGNTAAAEWTFSTVDRKDISNATTPNEPANPAAGVYIDSMVGTGNTGRLVGLTQTHWTVGFTVALNLNENTLILGTGGNSRSYNGAISGNGELRVINGGQNHIGGSTGNTYTGTTNLNSGPVYLEKSSGNALCGTITLNNAAGLLWSANNQISDASPVSLATTGSLLNLNGHADTIASLALTAGAGVQTGTGGVLTTAVLTIDGAVMGAGTYTAATHAFVTGTGSVVVTTGGGPAFDTWAGTDTGGKGLTGAAAAFDADPDHDGIPNGIEFVLGGEPNPANPGANSRALLPTAAASGDNLVFTFTRRHEAAFLNPQAEFSNDLAGAWTSAVDPGNSTIAVTPGSLADTVTVTLPKGPNTRMFARLKVVTSAVAGGISPRVTTSPQDQVVVGGGDFTLTAAAGGAQGVTWQWYFNGSAIAGATSNSYTVTGATPAHQGDYHVVVSNAQGNSASAVAHVAINTTPGVAGLNLIPWPLDVQTAAGVLTVQAGARIVATDASLVAAATVLATEIAAAHARTLPVVTTAAADGDIVLALDAALTGERHKLAVDTRATVSGGSAFSVSLGTATLLQALRTETGALVCPRVAIDDTPAVAIRALHLDLARQNHSLESLLQAVDLCRLYKVNYLHLHFNDDQGYTFPSTAYPLLNTATISNGHMVYTLAEMQALEAYAVARGVYIMPELEGPGHNHLMLDAYPALFKITYPITADAPYEPSSSVNVAKPEVRAAWRTLIGEMCAVFQSTPYFHLGCDEVDWAWSQYNTDFQAAFVEWGFTRSNPADNVHLVFSKFITLARDYAAEFGKKSIVWENWAVTGSPEVPAPTDVLVMPFDCWNPAAFTANGLKLVNAAWTPLYVVGYAKKPVSDIYAWDRTRFGMYSGENVDYTNHIIAAQDVAGTQLTTFEQIEDMEMMSVRARLAAMNERTWNPSLGVSYANFRSRLASTDALLDSVLSPVRISYDGMDDPDDRVFSGNAIVSMSLAPGSAGQGLTIRYTTSATNTANAANVTNTSTLYTGPFQVSTSGVLRAAAFNAAGQRVGRMTRELYRHEMLTSANLASNKPVAASSGTNAAKAVDLRLAEGWNTTVSDTRPAGETLTVDLESAQNIDRAAIIFDPSGTYFYRIDISLDNNAWTTVVDTSSAGTAATRAGITHAFASVSARYVRLTLLPHAGNNGDKIVREFMVTGNATTYDGIDDPPAQKTAWVGRNVAFLTASATRNPVVMDKLTTTFDAVFDYYAEATGQLPSPYLTYQGRSLVAEVTTTCGAGCGYLGVTGIELEAGTFDLLYQGVSASDQYEQTLFYEFGRNFYFYDGKIRYKESGPLAAPAGESGWIGTGYAVLMRFASMDATGVKGAPFGGTPFATFRASVEGMVDTYTANASLNFQNTLLINQHPAGGGTTDFFASFCLRLAKWYGPQVLTRMWREIGARADATTTQDAVDNWFLGCCYGTQRNLATLFTSNWKIPVSAAAQTEALTRWGTPPATFP